MFNLELPPFNAETWAILGTLLLLEGLLSLVLHDVPVVCAPNELARFAHPPDLTCQSYAGPYAETAGGYVTTLAGDMCGYCQYATGDEFAASFSAYYVHQWRNYGIFCGYLVFNFAVVFLCTWLYLQGGRGILQKLSPKARKQRRLVRGREVEAEKGERGE